MNGNRFIRILLSSCLAVSLAACSSQQITPSDPERDPWEAYNRKIHAFNMGFDKYLFRPVATGYDRIMPDAPQRGVRNFFRNLAYPVTFLNLILQGKFDDSLTATGRFLMNMSLGVFGFFDVASKAGIPEFDEDFGQTLAVWGWKDSRFLVMPVFGPYTARDFLGRPRVCCSFLAPNLLDDSLKLTGVLDFGELGGQQLGEEQVAHLRTSEPVFTE